MRVRGRSRQGGKALVPYISIGCQGTGLGWAPVTHACLATGARLLGRHQDEEWAGRREV